MLLQCDFLKLPFLARYRRSVLLYSLSSTAYLASSQPTAMSEQEELLWGTVHSSIWLNVITQLPVKHRFVVSLVCKAWRSQVLSLCEHGELQITLLTSRSCGALGTWLRRHGHLLSTLNITDCYYSHVNVPGSTRIGAIDRLAMLQGLHGNGRLLHQLQSVSLCLNELSAADAAVLGLCNCPALTCLKLDSNGSNIGMTGAQGLAPLSQLQQLIAPTQSLGDQGLQVSALVVCSCILGSHMCWCQMT